MITLQRFQWPTRLEFQDWWTHWTSILAASMVPGYVRTRRGQPRSAHSTRSQHLSRCMVLGQLCWTVVSSATGSCQCGPRLTSQACRLDIRPLGAPRVFLEIPVGLAPSVSQGLQSFQVTRCDLAGSVHNLGVSLLNGGSFRQRILLESPWRRACSSVALQAAVPWSSQHRLGVKAHHASLEVASRTILVPR